jgi:N-acetylmuramoyl-L-alanine amidase
MRSVIRIGDVGPEVRDVQRRLCALLIPALAQDGVFGAATLDAVRRFQRVRGLPADGIVGPETWRALVEAGHTLGDRLLWRSAVPMRGDDVKELQHRLNQLGFDAGTEDGIFGPLTQAAVEDFQRNVGLEVDGFVGASTVESLRRLRRAHQSPGVGIRARQLESLRRLASRGIVGARVLIDPARGADDPGHIGPSGITEATVAWRVATRLAARLHALGAHVLLSRGPHSNPPATLRARQANEQGIELVLGIAVNALDSPVASGASSYYYGTPQFVSEPGYRLAEVIQTAMTSAGWLPDCRVHPMTWTILHETRMPAAVALPGFITSPADEARLADGACQELLAGALSSAIGRFCSRDVGTMAVSTLPKPAALAF